MRPAYEHFPHGADVGVRGLGRSSAEAFEQTALALTATVTDPGNVASVEAVEIECAATDTELLLNDWLNAIVYEMATRGLVFGEFEVRIDDGRLPGIVRASYAMPDAHWGYGEPADLERIEEHGAMAGAVPEEISSRARDRQRNEMGTLGSGNHYLEIQHVSEIFDETAATAFGLETGDILATIHCGSRGLGHQIGTEFLRSMAAAAGEHGIRLPDRELACAPIRSPIGESYLGAMRAGINCALANRQIISHLTRAAFAQIAPEARLTLLYDVSHNTCKVERHVVDGERKVLYVHRKGATRACGPGHPDLPDGLRDVGQPVLIGGSMGTGSYILCGTSEGEALSFSSSCHGAGRAMSRHQAKRTWRGSRIVGELAERGILIRSRSMPGIAEEAPKCVQGRSQCRRRGGRGRFITQGRAARARRMREGLSL